ncbi:hypothetical protein C7H11_06465 [Escherichia coli]|nr:hypothetical protein C7H11_06465 [Escherichia coli]
MFILPPCEEGTTIQIVVANDKAVGWNWSSGAYNANIGGASTLIIHFYMGDGSCPAAQFRINYKNGGIF